MSTHIRILSTYLAHERSFDMARCKWICEGIMHTPYNYFRWSKFCCMFFLFFQDQSGFGSEVKGVEQTHALRSIHYTFFTCCVCEKNALSESILWEKSHERISISNVFRLFKSFTDLVWSRHWIKYKNIKVLKAYPVIII